MDAVVVDFWLHMTIDYIRNVTAWVKCGLVHDLSPVTMFVAYILCFSVGLGYVSLVDGVVCVILDWDWRTLRI